MARMMSMGKPMSQASRDESEGVAQLRERSEKGMSREKQQRTENRWRKNSSTNINK